MEEKVLSYEHFPPRSAFNKNTKFYLLSTDEYFEKFVNYINGEKPKKKPRQGGLGDYCLCEECNNFLGYKYVNDYVNFAKICYGLINEIGNFKAIQFKFSRSEINLKNFLKQATAIFICNNGDWFTSAYPELLEFVKNPDYYDLPEKFRFYMYLNNEGQYKNGNCTFDNINGTLCEFVFPPFGLILNIENENKLIEVSEITDFKNFDRLPHNEFVIVLNKYPAYSPIPLDFRGKEEFKNL